MSQRSKILRAAIYILVVGVGIYLIRGFIRRFLVQPIYFIVVFIFEAFTSLPQQMVWAGLVIIGILIALNVISKGNPKRSDVVEPKRYYPSRVETWEEWLKLANEGELSRFRLARELSNLTLSTIAYCEGISISDARRKLQNDGILLPEETKKLMTSVPQGGSIGPIKQFIRSFSRSKDFHSIMDEVEVTTRYLESELEVQSGKSGI